MQVVIRRSPIKKRRKPRQESASILKIAAAHAGIPSFDCKSGCSECCGPVIMSCLEWERICERLGCEPKGDWTTLNCPMLKDGRCSVYDIRPTICRLFGVVKGKLLCPHGCRSERLLTDAEAQMLIGKVERLGA